MAIISSYDYSSLVAIAQGAREAFLESSAKHTDEEVVAYATTLYYDSLQRLEIDRLRRERGLKEPAFSIDARDDRDVIDSEIALSKLTPLTPATERVTVDLDAAIGVGNTSENAHRLACLADAYITATYDEKRPFNGAFDRAKRIAGRSDGIDLATLIVAAGRTPGR